MKNGWQISTPVQTEEDFIAQFSSNEIPEVPAASDEPAVPTEAPAAEPAKPFVGRVNNEEEFANEFGEPEPAENSPETPASTEPDAAPAPKTLDGAYLKGLAEYKAQKYGIDLSDVGDVEWTPEKMGELEDMIDEIRLEEKYGDFKSSDPFLEAVLDIAENGGNPEGLIKLIQQRKELNDFDTSTLDGKVAKIKSYYENVEKKSPDWINRQIARITTGDSAAEVDEELKFVEGEHDKYMAAQKKIQVEKSQRENEARIENHKRQVESFNTALKEKKFSDKEVGELSNYVFDDTKWKMKGSNQTFSDFDYAIMKAKASPAELSDLALFLKDKELYNKKIINSAKNTAATNEFKTIVDKAANSFNGGVDGGQTSQRKHKFQFKLS